MASQSWPESHGTQPPWLPKVPRRRCAQPGRGRSGSLPNLNRAALRGQLSLAKGPYWVPHFPKPTLGASWDPGWTGRRNSGTTAAVCSSSPRMQPPRRL